MSLLDQLKDRYSAPSSSLWMGREDSSYIHQHVQLINLIDFKNINDPSIGILGFLSDEGIQRNLGRKGAATAPLLLRQCLGKLPLNRDDIIYLSDLGNISCTDGNLEGAQAALGAAVEYIIKRKVHPIILGGGHEVAFGTYLGLAEAYPKEELTIVNFDAHYDLRPTLDGKSTSGSPFLQISEHRHQQSLSFNYLCIGIQKYGNSKALFEKARELNVTTVFAEDLYLKPVHYTESIVQEIIDSSKNIYISLCMDVFSAAQAPGVSAPQSLGITPWQIIPLLRMLAKSKKVICFEVAELSPPLDIHMRTTQLAASLISDYLHHIYVTM